MHWRSVQIWITKFSLFNLFLFEQSQYECLQSLENKLYSSEAGVILTDMKVREIFTVALQHMSVSTQTGCAGLPVGVLQLRQVGQTLWAHGSAAHSWLWRPHHSSEHTLAAPGLCDAAPAAYGSFPSLLPTWALKDRVIKGKRVTYLMCKYKWRSSSVNNIT